MYLSQLLVNPRNRDARVDLADRFELHRTLLAAFPTTLSDDERVLFRVEETRDAQHMTILVQSMYQPNWDKARRLNLPDYLLDIPRVRIIEPIVTPTMQLPFRLLSNPTIKRDGKRHGITSEEDLLRWLERKAQANGFSLQRDAVQVRKLGKKYGKRRRQVWHAVQFDGFLVIEDRDQFTGAIMNGIGSAKAFGFGLLSVPHR